ncbi:hypothetical protein EYC84_004413 [Monilinia fructicola]|uniref:Transmembrane protein n=1 Tax=Monilinia fructicola TaxID=38448 RepID=A0A5M9K444_MONFR|nr:hypothetical protein EYC84_004413 [Monilinia fructicola]
MTQQEQIQEHPLDPLNTFKFLLLVRPAIAFFTSLTSSDIIGIFVLFFYILDYKNRPSFPSRGITSSNTFIPVHNTLVLKSFSKSDHTLSLSLNAIALDALNQNTASTFRISNTQTVIRLNPTQEQT